VTWSFTTLDATTNVSPADLATDQTPGVTIDWSGVTGNKGYIYELDEAVTFDSPDFQTGSTAINSSQQTLSDLKRSE